MNNTQSAKSGYTEAITNSIKKAQNEEVFFEEIYSNIDLHTGKNEFLFFIKPEITLKSQILDLGKILGLIQEKLETFNLKVHNIKVLSASYLEKFNIIAQHYGVINKLSSDVRESISDGAKVKFLEIFGKSFDECNVLGGNQLLTHYPYLNPYSLDYLWQNVINKKLAGGTYCEEIKIDNEEIFLVNGFHPRQLRHFTEKGRSIVVFTLSGDLSWSNARTNFIGATNPASAIKGSLRRELLENMSTFGLAEVSQGVNGVHLSAGPVEALVELKRYNSNFSSESKIKDFSSFSFGRQLAEHFAPETIEKILSNVNVTVDNKWISVFDLTEEKDSDEAIALLKQYF